MENLVSSIIMTMADDHRSSVPHMKTGLLVFGVMIVRNEADIIGLNVRYHLMHGIDRLLIVDNGSSDGTDRVLRELSKDRRVQWASSPGPFRQAAMTTELVREAYLQGAEWVLPIDADEFWWAPRGNLRAVLTTSAAGALQVQGVDFIQRRDVISASPEALLSMTRRVSHPVGTLEQGQDLVESRKYAFVEVKRPTKWISRATLGLQIAPGNHKVEGLSAQPADTDEIIRLHAPLRARSIFEAQVEHGRRVEAVPERKDQAWHVRRWMRIAEAGQLDLEWAANSYENDSLDVYGAKHPVVFDGRLRDVAAPWIDTCGSNMSSIGGFASQPKNESLASTNADLATDVSPRKTLTSPVNSSTAHGDSETPIDSPERRELVIRVQQQEKGIAFLREQIAERDQLLEEREKDIAWLQTVVAEQHATIASNNQAIAWLEGGIKNRDAKIAELERGIEWLRSRDRS